MTKSMEKTLEEEYYNSSSPAFLAGVDAVYRATKRKDNRITKGIVKKWLRSQETYTLHKPAKRKYKRGKIIASKIDERWQADLVDLRSISKYNDGIKYLNVVIDVFSKFAWVIPLKRKGGDDLVEAFKVIFRETRTPCCLQTDKGSEYMNRIFQDFLRKKNIIFFTSSNETKASVVERLNRTLKTKIWRYFTWMSTRRYIDVLPDIVRGYNNSFHSAIQMKPSEVNPENENSVWESLYGHHSMKEQTVGEKYRTGGKVRISKYKRIFDKGYLPNWTREIFTIAKRLDGNPTMYYLKDDGGEEIKGGFYKEEIQEIKKDDNVYKVEEILRTRKRKGNKEHFVKWLGYPEKFNSWISEHDIV